MDNLPLGSTTAVLRDTANEVCQSVANVNCVFWSEKYTKELLTCQESKWDYFKKYWLDMLVLEYSYMVWCTVYNTMRKKMTDKKADKQSEKAEKLFKEKFE